MCRCSRIGLHDKRWGDIMKNPSSNIDKIEFSFHVLGHSVRETMELFADILCESCTSPTSHFLDFSIRIAGQRQSIGSPTTQGVCIDASDWYAPSLWIVEEFCSTFNAGSYVVVGDVKTLSINKECRKESVELKIVLADMCNSST